MGLYQDGCQAQTLVLLHLEPPSDVLLNHDTAVMETFRAYHLQVGHLWAIQWDSMGLMRSQQCLLYGTVELSVIKKMSSKSHEDEANVT